VTALTFFEVSVKNTQKTDRTFKSAVCKIHDIKIIQLSAEA
jgi:hypothetical protein